MLILPKNDVKLTDNLTHKLVKINVLHVLIVVYICSVERYKNLNHEKRN